MPITRQVCGIGVDLVYIPRFEKLIGKHGNKILQRIFAEQEIQQAPQQQQQASYYASRWAVKEATVKALGQGGLGSKCIQLGKDKKQVVLLGQAQEYAQAKLQQAHASKMISHVTLSHEKDYAIAMVVLEYEKE